MESYSNRERLLILELHGEDYRDLFEWLRELGARELMRGVWLLRARERERSSEIADHVQALLVHEEDRFVLANVTEWLAINIDPEATTSSGGKERAPLRR